MARPKRPPHPMLQVAREHLRRIDATLSDAPLHLHQLDGPPGGPRYAVSVGVCRRSAACPYGVAEGQPCTVLDCELRDAVRLLLDRDGNLLEVLRNGVRWSS